MVAALLTGRGNNTLKDKNILEILGHPVLYYPATAALNAKQIDHYFVSSDDDKILACAEKYGYLPIKRPAIISQPNSQHIDAIMHGLDVIESRCGEPDILVVLLANNITIDSKTIDNCISIMQADMSISAVVPVIGDNDVHPYRAKRIENGYLRMFVEKIDGHISTNRQDLEPCYFLSHNFWVLNVKSLKSNIHGDPPWSFMGPKAKPYIVEMSLDIHTEFDLLVAAQWLKYSGMGNT